MVGVVRGGFFFWNKKLSPPPPAALRRLTPSAKDPPTPPNTYPPPPPHLHQPQTRPTTGPPPPAHLSLPMIMSLRSSSPRSCDSDAYFRVFECRRARTTSRFLYLRRVSNSFVCKPLHARPIFFRAPEPHSQFRRRNDPLCGSGMHSCLRGGVFFRILVGVAQPLQPPRHTSLDTESPVNPVKSPSTIGVYLPSPPIRDETQIADAREFLGDPPTSNAHLGFGKGAPSVSAPICPALSAIFFEDLALGSADIQLKGPLNQAGRLSFSPAIPSSVGWEMINQKQNSWVDTSMFTISNGFFFFHVCRHGGGQRAKSARRRRMALACAARHDCIAVDSRPPEVRMPLSSCDLADRPPLLRPVQRLKASGGIAHVAGVCPPGTFPAPPAWNLLNYRSAALAELIDGAFIPKLPYGRRLFLSHPRPRRPPVFPAFSSSPFFVQKLLLGCRNWMR